VGGAPSDIDAPHDGVGEPRPPDGYRARVQQTPVGGRLLPLIGYGVLEAIEDLCPRSSRIIPLPGRAQGLDERDRRDDEGDDGRHELPVRGESPRAGELYRSHSHHVATPPATRTSSTGPDRDLIINSLTAADAGRYPRTGRMLRADGRLAPVRR
jgi:hypothetical protein